MKTFMFPGQGSQSKGMGKSLFDEFEDLTKTADDILGYSIKELCTDDPRKELGKTQFTQPALFVVNALSYCNVIEQNGEKPDFVAGHSLGEFNALCAAECFDFETGLKIVKKRGELMSQATDGGMAAIINASEDQIREILAKNELTNIDLANFNTPSQIVISGAKNEIARAQEFFQEGKILYYPLNTSGAFHSRFMQSAKQEFEVFLNKFTFSTLEIPVIANVTARPYLQDEVAKNLATQIAGSVRWFDSIHYLMSRGSEQSSPMEFHEIGNGDVLTKMIMKIKRETPDGLLESLRKIDDVTPPGMNNVNTAAISRPDEPVVVPELTNGDHIQPVSSAGDKSKDHADKATDIRYRVSQWNESFPIGTKVKSSIINDENLETSSEAVVLFGHRAAVYIKGYNGYFDLNELTPAQN